MNNNEKQSRRATYMEPLNRRLKGAPSGDIKLSTYKELEFIVDVMCDPYDEVAAHQRTLQRLTGYIDQAEESASVDSYDSYGAHLFTCIKFAELMIAMLHHRRMEWIHE